MSATTRLWFVVVPLALAAGAASFAVTLTSDHQDVPRLTSVLVLLTGWSFIAAGLIARTRRPHNRIGLLLIAVGFGWFAGAPYAANDSLLWTIGVALSAASGGFLIHLLLAYPTGRLESRWDRGLVTFGYVLTAFAMLPVLFVDRTPIEGCAECPDNAFLLWDSPTTADIVTVIIEAIAVVFLLAAVATLARRWRRSSPAARRVLTPVVLAGGTTLFLFAISVGTQSMWRTFSDVTTWLAMIVLIEVPFLFLWGLLQSRLARADIGRALADGLAGGAPGRIRQLLHDPTAELLYARTAPAGGYVDAMGRPREPAGGEDGRAVTHIERKGRALAAILHDSALLEEPELLEQVAAAVGLEVERDKNLLALQASERRSRALIDAMPDNMFRISADGVFLDIQENPSSDLGPVYAQVGSSVYDYPVPRELIDRVMAAGSRALETGELQTIEWQIEEGSVLHHQEGRFMPSGDREFFLVVRDVTARKRQELEQKALHSVALAVASEAKTEHVFDLVAEEIARVLGAHTTNLIRFEPGGKEGAIVGGWRKPGARGLQIGHQYPLEGGASEAVLKTGRPMRVELGDDDIPPALAEQMRRLDAHSVVAAPIKLAGRPWGAVVATLMAPASFSPGAEERLGAFTRLVSLALANEEARGELAASRARLVSAGDEERRRLERNLHDGAQQRLVSLSLSLRLAQSKLASDPDGARELLAAAGLELNVALEELRELARGIHPAVLTERGLAPALESLADRSPLPVELELPREARLPRRVEAAAYYVVSEALTNVAKYADASCVTVKVAQENGYAVVQVVDDGVGGADPTRGTGLRGLMDRIDALDGTLSVQSRPGAGTRVRAEIPFALRAGPQEH